MKKQSNNSKYLYFSAIAILVVVFSMFILEKSQITNFYTKPIGNSINEDTRPINDIQYTPADPTDNNEINRQKEEGTIGNSTNTPSTGTPINVVLTAAGQDEAGGPVVVRVLLSDITSGTCDLNITKDLITKSYSAAVINSGTYYNCDGFDIPIEELEPGTWKLNVTVTDSDRSGTVSKDVQVGN